METTLEQRRAAYWAKQCTATEAVLDSHLQAIHHDTAKLAARVEDAATAARHARGEYTQAERELLVFANAMGRITRSIANVIR
jgi:hypothetical protein